MGKAVLLKFLDKSIVLFLQFWLLIDMINGYLINNGIYPFGGISFGEGTRIVFLFLLLLSLKIGKSKNDFVLIAIPYLLVVLSLAQFLIIDNNVIKNISISTKLSVSILLFIFIKNKMHYYGDTFNSIIYINTFILLFNLYISFLGIGFSNYVIRAEGISFGGTGFFYAGNEVSGLLLALYSIFLFKVRDSLFKSVIITFVFFAASIALLSKAPIFGVLIIFCIYLVKYNKLSYTKIATLLTIFIYLLYDLILASMSQAINRWSYFIEEYGALTYLTGGYKRWEMVNAYFEKLMEHPFLLIIGNGWSGLAEQNFIDLLEGFGFVGVMVFLIWIYWVANIYKKLNYRNDKMYALLTFSLIIVIATLAGHIIQSAMIAPFIAILANLDILNHHQRDLFIV